MKYKVIVCPYCGAETRYTKSYRFQGETVRATQCATCYAIIDNKAVTPYEVDV